jgi:hypothetical protein
MVVADWTGAVPVLDTVKTVEILVDRTSIETFREWLELSSTRFARLMKACLLLDAQAPTPLSPGARNP